MNRMAMFGVSVCYAFALTASAQGPPPQLDPDSFGVIEGAVIDPQGQPVDGAFVYSVGNAEGKLPLGGRWPPGPSTTTNTAGNFVLDHVFPDNPVSVYASKYSDYYEDVSDAFIFNRPKYLRIPEVEVKPGQTVTGVIFRLPKKAGKLHWYVRDADTKELVHGVFMQSCRKGVPTKYCVGGMSGPADYERTISLGVGVSIKIEADDGLHEKWEYRDSKTGSRYFLAKSGETETVNIYLRKIKKPTP